MLLGEASFDPMVKGPGVYRQDNKFVITKMKFETHIAQIEPQLQCQTLPSAPQSTIGQFECIFAAHSGFRESKPVVESAHGAVELNTVFP